MKLDVVEWKPFLTSRLFPLMENGKANQQMLDEGMECFYIGAKKNDNGVMFHCQRDEDLMTKGNCIVFICNGQGSVGYANYMDVDFIGTTDIVAGYNENLNEHIGAFLATIYSQERPKYSFGRKWKTHLKDTEVKLPVQHNIDGSLVIDRTCLYSDEGFVPDWQFMEDYIKSLHYKPLTTSNKAENAIEFNTTEWQEFRVGTLFDIHPTKTIDGISADECCGHGTPLVVNQSYNNGVAGFCNYFPTEKGGIITFSDTWEGETFFYQHDDFIGFAHVQGMHPKNFEPSPECMIFICTVLEFDARGRYSYGRKKRRDIISEVKLKLPIQHNTDGTPYIDDTHKFSDEGYVPDWQFMKDYIKSLPYGDRI